MDSLSGPDSVVSRRKSIGILAALLSAGAGATLINNDTTSATTNASTGANGTTPSSNAEISQPQPQQQPTLTESQSSIQPVAQSLTGQLTVSDTRIVTVDGQPDLYISVDGTVEYTDIGADPATLILELYLGITKNDLINPSYRATRRSYSVTEQEGLGTTAGKIEYDISDISLFETDSLRQQMFSAADGERKSTEVVVGLRSFLRDNDQTLITDQATDSATVTVINRPGTIRVEGNATISDK